MRLGLKSTFNPKLGQKQIHAFSKFGAKASEVVGSGAGVAGLLGAVAPEVSVPLEIGALVGGRALKGLEKATRKK